MTEDEAKRKWCPFGRVVSRVGPENLAGFNRSNDGRADHESLCLASGCMAWRWRATADRDGFCGLAGEPAAE